MGNLVPDDQHAPEASDDDAREHLKDLRAIHFSTIAVGFALLVASLVSGGAELKTALSDLKSIRNLVVRSLRFPNGAESDHDVFEVHFPFS